ncbi:MAG TPA: TetR/AcrR family transcriptional regulator [Caldilineae bacterium]|jgi:AcrR family transcriptional regulator|nr:TetR/AcrR family transcriptional regulator [Caldilineae bacterium]
MAPPRTNTTEDRRTQILQAAMACFARQGYHRTTMDDIVHESGLSKGSLYWYFKSKKDLFLAIIDAWISDINRTLQELSQMEEMTWTDRLRRAAELIAMDIAKQRDFASLTMEFWAEMQQDEQVRERLVRIYNETLDVLQRFIAAGIKAGEFRPIDPRAAAAVLIAAFDGMMLQWSMMPDQIKWPDLGQSIVDIIIHGLERRKGHDG